jgi:pimeloyl-ACP methyl ester carboxylesterase
MEMVSGFWFVLRPNLHCVVTSHDLHVETHGPTDAPSLLLLHGWGSDAGNMRPLTHALSDTYRTYAVDLPGHGASPPPPAPWGVPEYAHLVRDVLQDRVGRPSTVIGHSNGGRIALHMASTPDLAEWVQRLVLISPSGVEPERSWGQELRSGLATTLKTPIRVLPAPLREPAEDWLRHTLLWRWLGSSDYNAASGVMRETFVKTVNFHLDDALDRIHVPTLLFWGTEDPAVSRRQVEVLQSKIEDCGLVELEGAGHYGHLDDIDTVHSGIRYFLEHT